MENNMPSTQLYARPLVAALLFLALFLSGLPDAHAKKKLPETTDDGLVLVEHTKLRAVYMKPGATLTQYDRVALLECFVEFKKGWEREYNENEIGAGQMLTQKDLDEIKQRLANEFKVVFTKELTDKGYPIVDEGAKDVLVVRPAIINLEVTAPDTMQPGMEVTFVASTGQMTLYMELYDSVSNELLARVIDPEAAQDMGGFAVSANRVTNKADADRILRRWADILASHLGSVAPRN
jgi:hypothetical protein